MQVYSPIEGYSESTQVGSLTLNFHEGVAEVTQEPTEAELLYLVGAGYDLAFPETPDGFPESPPLDSWGRRVETDEEDPNTVISVGKTMDAAEGTEDLNVVLPVVDMLPVVDADALNAQDDSEEPVYEPDEAPRPKRRRR